MMNQDLLSFPVNSEDMEFREIDVCSAGVGKQIELGQSAESKALARHFDKRIVRELFLSLCSSRTGVTEEFIHKLFENNISYRNLATLTDEDLMLMGLENEDARKELLLFFAGLPNQAIAFQNIIHNTNMPYNNFAIDGAILEIDKLNCAISYNNIMLKMRATKDIVLGEKYYASRYAIQTLEEMNKVSDDMDTTISELEMIIKNTQITEKMTEGGEKVKNPIKSTRKWLIVSSAFTCAAAVLWFWKMKKLIL